MSPSFTFPLIKLYIQIGNSLVLSEYHQNISDQVISCLHFLKQLFKKKSFSQENIQLSRAHRGKRGTVVNIVLDLINLHRSVQYSTVSV